ncbi:hypothetical protein GVX82_04855 [Patescibacteria group bacterium]|jgi:thymidylate synthase ThyX|nr:hypothetical protein [Patescibacteria group bacterium]
MALDSLTHTTRALPEGGTVLVLNTGAEIGPEAQAMLAALHSRSVGGIESHLTVLAERGAEKFMSTYYVGYGHKSIGDLGSATVFVEGVSMLAAKAIQDWPLYAGQESSTRYIDFAEQPFINPLGTKESEEILESWRAFYLAALEQLVPVLKERFPRDAEEKETTYDKAINARAFDTLRSFLPAGAATNLAWHGNLRQFADKLPWLRHHPLEEVQKIGEAIEDALIEAFPNSFDGEKNRYEATEGYVAAMMSEFCYFDDPLPQEFALTRDAVDRTTLAHYRDALAARPQKTELPKILAECGTLTYSFLLDFGSFRDIQRHRAVTQQMPLLGVHHGFHPWYLGELPPTMRAQAETLIEAQAEKIERLPTTPEVKQYYTAMGFLTTNRLTGTLPALAYLAELRATRFVHPTLRERAVQLADSLTTTFKQEGLILHLDAEPDRFDAKRGEQDIVRNDA